MRELYVYRGSGSKPNFSEIAKKSGMDRHSVAKYWREGEAAVDERSASDSAFAPLEEEIRAKAQLLVMDKSADPFLQSPSFLRSMISSSRFRCARCLSLLTVLRFR